VALRNGGRRHWGGLKGPLTRGHEWNLYEAEDGLCLWNEAKSIERWVDCVHKECEMNACRKGFHSRNYWKVLIKFGFRDILSKLRTFLLLFLVLPQYMFLMPLKPNCLELSQEKIILRNLSRPSLTLDVYTTFVISRLLVRGWICLSALVPHIPEYIVPQSKEQTTVLSSWNPTILYDDFDLCCLSRNKKANELWEISVLHWA